MERWTEENRINDIDRGAPASMVIARWGSLYRFCTDSKRFGSKIGRPNGFARGTVHRWIVKGSIDSKHHAAILKLGKLSKVGVVPLDFVDTRAA